MEGQPPQHERRGWGCSKHAEDGDAGPKWDEGSGVMVEVAGRRGAPLEKRV